MMYLVHGNDIAAIEKRVGFIRQKSGQRPIIRRDGRLFNLKELEKLHQQIGLFSQTEPLLIVKNAQAIKAAFWRQLPKIATGQLMVIFTSHQQVRNPKILSLFPRQNIYLCRPRVTIFSFLESIGRQPLASSLRFFNQLSLVMPAQLILYWLKHYFRDLYWLANNQPLKSGWQLDKQKQHLNNLGGERVVWWYQRLLWLDYQQKIGRLPEGLEIALVNLFWKDYHGKNEK